MFFSIEDNQITTYFFGIYGIWTPCIPCTPCTNDLNLLQKPVSLVSDVALVMVTRPFAGDHRSSPVQADI